MIEGARWRRWVFFHIPLMLFIVGLLFPFYWMIVTTVRPDNELYRPWNAANYTPFWTMHPTLEHIRDLLTETLFSTWLMMGYFKSIPKELEECARIDGAPRWKAMAYIIFPIAIPGILSAGIFAFTLSWNEFIYALVFLSSPEQKTVPVGVTSELVRGDVFYWGELMAGALLGSIPVAIAYSFFVEHYVAGLTGSVKG